MLLLGTFLNPAYLWTVNNMFMKTMLIELLWHDVMYENLTKNEK